MKQLTLTIAILGAFCAVSLAGSEQYSGKDMKQVAPVPCAEYYADTEWNVNVFGAYAWSNTDSNRSDRELADDGDGSGLGTRYGEYDKFLAQDHAWGGGVDIKYFFHKYFGIGVEGLAVSGHSRHLSTDETAATRGDEERYSQKDHVVEGALGTLTIRRPIGCTRFSPYAWGGLGGYFNGNNDRPAGVAFERGGRFFDNRSENRFAGQFGGGLEVRITRHIGITTDVSWNVVEGPKNDFGMARTGVNFAF